MACGRLALVIAGGADGAIGDAERGDQLAIAAGVTDADGPGISFFISAGQVEIAAGIMAKS